MIPCFQTMEILEILFQLQLTLKVQYYSREQIMTIPQEFFHERLQGPVGTFKLLNKM